MQKLNTTLVYILSVVSLLCCCIYGIGTIAAIIAVIVASKELKKYHLDPEAYTNGPQMKTAKTVAIIALVICLIGVAIMGYFAYLYFSDPCAFWDSYLELAAKNPGVTEEQLAPIYEDMERRGCK